MILCIWLREGIASGLYGIQLQQSWKVLWADQEKGGQQ